MNATTADTGGTRAKGALIMDRRSCATKMLLGRLGRGFLLCVTAVPTAAVVFILFFIFKESLPFFENLGNVREFFTSANWAPSREGDPHFGALAILYGTLMVTVGSCAVAVPLGITAAICLSEIVNARISRIFRPVVELFAAIPSVAYGFFAMAVFAPLLQNHGGIMISALILAAGLPIAGVSSIPFAEFASTKIFKKPPPTAAVSLRIFAGAALCSAVAYAAWRVSGVEISSGTNAFNASVILAIMALPTIVSISQDVLSAVGRDMREGSLALGATRFETIFKVILPCAKSGIAVAVILGFMRVIGETMVVWMASGNSLKIPGPFYNFFEPVRTLTATIAGEMGEADQTTGSARYHVLFAMSLCLLVSGMALNWLSQRIISRGAFARKRGGK